MTSEDTHRELRKRFVRSFLDLTVLRMLADEPLWGYRLMTKIKEDHDVKVGPPVIYPLLDSLEAGGLVEARETYEGKRKRKIYNITQEGIERVEYYRGILLEFSK